VGIQHRTIHLVAWAAAAAADPDCSERKAVAVALGMGERGLYRYLSRNTRLGMPMVL